MNRKTLALDNIFAFKQFRSGQAYVIKNENEFQLHGTYPITSNYAKPSLLGNVKAVIKIKLTKYGNQVVTVPSYFLNPYIIDSGFGNLDEWLDDVENNLNGIPRSTAGQVNKKTFDLLLV